MNAHVELGAGDGKFALSMLHSGRPVWVYDTFNGFPLHTLQDNEPKHLCIRIGQVCDKTVKETLESSGVHCVEGLFPYTFHLDHPESVELVHVDMDTYSTTISALQLFDKLMVPGGTFLIHDYNNDTLSGVKRAVDEFMQSKAAAEYDRQPHPNCFRLVKRNPASPTT